MLINCRWCPISKNGQIAINDHERQGHPKEYWGAKVENLKRSAERSLAEAQKLRERFGV